MKLTKFFIVTMMLLTISCGTKQEPQKTDDKQVTEEKKASVIVPKEELPFEFEMKKPDSAGNVYMDLTFKNNSKYPITYFNATVLLKDKNETTGFYTNNTVMPGETSPKIESFGPKTEKAEDYEIIKLEYTLQADDEEITVSYDYKLNVYEEAKTIGEID